MASWDLWGMVAHDAGGREDAEVVAVELNGRGIGALALDVDGGVERTLLVEAIML